MDKNGLSTNKIVMRAGGGLGQQLFAYAMYRYWEEKGINVYIDIDEVFNWRSWFDFLVEPYTFHLHEYFPNIKVNIVHRGDYAVEYYNPFASRIKDLIKTRQFSTLAGKIRRKIFRLPFSVKGSIFLEEPWNRHEYFFKFSRESNIFIERGYFLSYTAPFLLRDILLTEIVFDKQMPDYVQKILTKIENTNSVSIHVKRKEYIAPGYYYDRGYVCTQQYYKNAVDFMNAHYSDLKYYIFSDDMEWAMNNFGFLADYFIVDTSKLRLSAYYDMMLMSKCRHNIIANSSFSWWGAFLNQNNSKTVVCPTDFRSLYIRADEVYPSEWIRVMTVVPPHISAKYLYVQQ
jgi:hypothetical protein